MIHGCLHVDDSVDAPKAYFQLNQFDRGQANIFSYLVGL